MVPWLLSLLLLASAKSDSKTGFPHPAPAVRHGTLAEGTSPSDLDGFWQDIADPSFFLGLAEGRLLVASGDQLRSVSKVLRGEGGRLTVCDFGRTGVRELRLVGGELSFTNSINGESHRLRRISERPRVFALEPMPMPEGRPLPLERIEAIQIQLSKRLGEDQQTLLPPAGAQPIPSRPSFFAPPPREPAPESRSLRQAEVLAGNTAYLKELIAEVGWIDATRFGYGAANAAFLLAQHSRDLPLMLAALPLVEQDAKSGRLSWEDYALLYDRTRLLLGERQRYGTQVTYDSSDRPYLFPVEDPAAVPALRAKLGLIPLADYLKVFGGTEVRFSDECDPAHLPTAKRP